MRKINKKVFVAMSGGVDSSVAAALLKKQGYQVHGVFMKPWQPKGVVCLWRQDREDALRAASTLGIRFSTWDFSKQYKKLVADYMIKEYRAGRTPNPDIMCNKEIKFGLFLERALKEGADMIATGHYVRIKKDRQNSHLLRAIDSNKDQSYFLWTLTQKELKYCLFPIGNILKPKVRKLAQEFNLPNHDKKDSQGICFIGPLNMRGFLKNYIKLRPGRIIDTQGATVGTHDGCQYYTIGQRHGLDIKNGHGPYFVVRKDLRRNIVFVGKERELNSGRAELQKISWTHKLSKIPSQFGVRLRYRAPIRKAHLNKNGVLTIKSSERAITSGQSAVFYNGKEILGGGVIK